MNCDQCLKECKAACCGCFPIPKELYEKNKDKIVSPIKELPIGDDIMLITEYLSCAFLTKDFKCNIYNERPEICRKFGDETHLCLICSYQDKDGNIRSRQMRRKILREQEKNSKRILT
jgi:Fe-S-cluster containining protein